MIPAWDPRSENPDFHSQDYNVESIPLSCSLSYGMKLSCIPMVCNFQSTFSYNVISLGFSHPVTWNCFSIFTCLILLICIALLFIRGEGCCSYSIVVCLSSVVCKSVCNLSIFSYSKWSGCTFRCINKKKVTSVRYHLCVTHINRGQILRYWLLVSQFIIMRERRDAYFFFSVLWCSSSFLFCLFLCYIVPFQEQLCLPLHILEEKGLSQVALTVQALLELAPPKQQQHQLSAV